MAHYKIILLLLCSLSGFFAKAQSNGDAIFVENKGQWDEEVLFRATLPSGFLFLKKDRLQFSFYDADAVHKRHRFDSLYTKQKFEDKIEAYSYEVSIEGMQAPSRIIKKGEMPTPIQFFLGKRRVSDVHAYEHITYKNIYPDIDLCLFKSNEKTKTLKYEFLVHNGANPNQIKLKYHGCDVSQVDNRLNISTPFGTVEEGKPVSYQNISAKRKKTIRTAYQLDQKVLSFNLKQKYSPKTTLVIDPELIFSSFSGSFSDNWGNTATYDNDGHLYAGGVVFGADFPITTGSFQVSFGGVIDMGIMKYSPDGSNAEFITYLGGDQVETPHSMVVDNDGDLILYGTTSSANFPTTTGAFQETFGGGSPYAPFSGVNYNFGSDIVICRIKKDGKELLHSTFLGGSENDGVEDSHDVAIKNYGDSFRGEVIVDKDNNIYIASSTLSHDFPLKNPYRSTLQSQEAILVKLNPSLSALEFSTFLGGSKTDLARSLKIDTQENIFIAGTTLSKDFPMDPNAMVTTYNGRDKGFVAKFDIDGAYVSSTYVGESNACHVFFVDLDPEDNIFVLGSVIGNYPVSSDAYKNPNSGQFIHKISNDLTTSMRSTVFGTGSGQPDLSLTAFLVNECGNIYISGWGGEVNSSTGNNYYSTTYGLPVTEDAFSKETRGSDFYIMELDKDFKNLTYATFIGGSKPDHVDGGTSRFSKDGTIYHATCSCGGYSDTFPTTPTAWSTTNNSHNCNNASFKFNTENLSANFLILDPITLEDIEKGCASLDVVLKYDGKGAKEATWTVDGTVIHQKPVVDLPYTFDKGGKVEIKLEVVNNSTCTKSIEVIKYLTVHMPNFSIDGDKTICYAQPTELKASGVGNATFIWSPTTTMTNPNSATPTVSPTETTTYKVDITDENGCQGTKELTIKVLPQLIPDFETALIKPCGQAQYLSLKNTSQNAASVEWFIDGKPITSDEILEKYVFEENRSYEVKLMVRNALCSATLIKNIQPDYFTPFGVSPDTTICAGQEVQLHAQGSLQYQWSPSLGLDDPTSDSPIATPKTTTEYHVQLNDISGCKVDSIITVKVIPEVDFKVNIDLYEECGHPSVARFSNETEADSFAWDFGDGSSSDQKTPEPHTYEEAGNYDIKLHARYGKCTYTYQSSIKVLDTSEPLSNVITPNGDGINDTFELIGQHFRLELFNRWGKLIYESEDYQNDWGKESTAGVFYYVVTSRTGKVCKGWIEVIK